MNVVLGLLFASVTSFAAQNASTNEAEKANESSVMARLTEQIFNTIDQSAVDLNINGITIDTTAEKPADKVKTDNVQLTGMISFAGNWEVQLTNPEENSDENKENEQMKKIFPKMQADSRGLKLAVDLRLLPQQSTLDVRFFSNYDAAKKQWIARPLTVKVSNQMNKELLTIRLFSLSAKKVANPKHPGLDDITGTCQSDKILLDLTTGRNKQVPVDCSFSGTVSEKGYKIQFKYANK